jgi:hypothetical protein
VWGWGLVAATSGISALILVGISGSFTGQNGGKPDWASRNNADAASLLDVSPSSNEVPYYEIARTDLYELDINTLLVTVKTEAKSIEDLERITQDIGQQAEGSYSGEYDFLNMRYCSPDQFGIAGEPEDECHKSAASGRVSLSAGGEAYSGLPEGHFDVSLSSDPNCDDGEGVYADEEGLHMCSDQYGEAQYGGSGYAQYNEGVSPGTGSTESLEGMIRGGMIESDQNIHDVKISGSHATVIVSSEAPDGYAESVCDFALQAAQEYDNLAGSEDYIGISEVSVKKTWRPWSAATCSLY